MQWSDAVSPPSRRHLRQFAGLCLVVLPALAAVRAWSGRPDGWALALGAAGVLLGGLGLARPQALRWVYTGWMVVVFPIGWTVSRAALALVFRAIGRDELRLRRSGPGASYWRPRPRPSSEREYLRQS